MHPRRHRWRPSRSVVALAVAAAAAGCTAGAPKTYDVSSEEARIRDRTMRREIARTTFTLDELGMTYPETIKRSTTEPFEPHYKKLTELEVFAPDWEYFRELTEKRRKLIARRRAERRKLAAGLLAKRRHAAESALKNRAEARAREREIEEARAASMGVRPKYRDEDREE